MSFFDEYARRLKTVLETHQWDMVQPLAEALRDAWSTGHRAYLCGNGGSAANAMHLANDLNYGIAKDSGKAMAAFALPANTAVLTCLANDTGYADVFSRQLDVMGQRGDLLIVLSGSGNSPNVVKALESGRKLGMKTFALLGYGGGRCKELADVSIHIPIDDMQIAEDLQLIIGHMIMQWLYHNPPGKQ